jgi:hypothetical protein
MRFLCLLLTVLATSTASAQDFRIENFIFMEPQKEPLIRTLTLFSGDLVYDFSFADGEGKTIEQATLYDFTRDRFIVLDYGRKMKLEVTEETLVQILSELSGKVEGSNNSVLKEMANPHFDVNAVKDVITFTGKSLKYEVRTIAPQGKTAASDYQRFADASARLTTALQNGAPPMARIKVNEQLANDKRLPEEVTLTRSEGPIWENAKKLRSKHHFNWAHTKTDINRIEVLNKKMAEFKSVKWSEFRAVAAAAKADEKKR